MAEMIDSSLRNDAGLSGAMMRSSEALTSLPVTVVPSWNLASRRWKVIDCASGAIS